MKVIDLYVKIANVEELPRKIKIGNTEYKYDGGYFDKDGCKMIGLIDLTYENLNREVEIIEDTPKENNKIKAIECWYSMEDIKNNPELHNIMFDELKDKINEIIDKINGE